MLLQQYLIELMDSGQHQLLPVYACPLRAEERREVCCWIVYSAWKRQAQCLWFSEVCPSSHDKHGLVCV